MDTPTTTLVDVARETAANIALLFDLVNPLLPEGDSDALDTLMDVTHLGEQLAAIAGPAE